MLGPNLKTKLHKKVATTLEAAVLDPLVNKIQNCPIPEKLVRLPFWQSYFAMENTNLSRYKCMNCIILK